MKKITIFLMSLLLVISCCFAGCSTFKVDYVKYYNETVAEVNGYKITRHELINSYNNYGYNYYVSQLGKSKEEALESTLNLMIDRKVLVDYIKKDNNYALNDYDVNSIYQKVLDSLDSSFSSYITTARTMFDVDEPEKAEEEETSKVFKKADYQYKKRAELEYGSNKIVYVEDNEEVIENYALDEDFVKNYSSKSKNEIVTKLYAKFMENISNNKYNEEDFEKLHDKALSLMSKYLISYEYYLRDGCGNRYPTDTKGLVKRLIERMYDNEVESAYIANFEDYYVSNSVLSVTLLEEKYRDLCEEAHAKYANSLTEYYNYLKTIGSGAEMVYYTPDNATAKFGYFLHTLLPLDKEVVSQINDLKNSGIYGEEELKSAINNIVMTQTHQERNTTTGELIEGDQTIADILAEYDASVRSEDDFIDFMFRYTSDTATLTANKPYVIGYDGDTNYSGMVEEFTKEAVRLMKNNLTKTESADYIVTEYGVHLLYYVGDVKADFNYTDRNAVVASYDDTVANNLYYTYSNEKIGKTYFDVLFDLVYPASSGSVYASSNGYTDYETSLVKGLKGDNVKIYRTKLNNTLDVL